MRTTIAVLGALILFATLALPIRSGTEPARFEPAEAIVIEEAVYPVNAVGWGTVVLEVTVSVAGEVEDVKVIRDAPGSPRKRCVPSKSGNSSRPNWTDNPFALWYRWHFRSASRQSGFDAAGSQYVDLVAADIIDPTKVVRTALENAVSVASVLLLTEATLTEVPEPKTGRPDVHEFQE